MNGRNSRLFLMEVIMQNVTEIKASEFDAEVRQSVIPVVVDFFATWCPPCKSLAPIFDRVAGQYTGKVKFVKLNTDEAPDLSAEFGIRGVPTLLFIKDGKVATTLVGLRPEGDIKTAVDGLL
jgi:thioredoxin 1